MRHRLQPLPAPWPMQRRITVPGNGESIAALFRCSTFSQSASRPFQGRISLLPLHSDTRACHSAMPFPAATGRGCAVPWSFRQTVPRPRAQDPPGGTTWGRRRERLSPLSREQPRRRMPCATCAPSHPSRASHDLAGGHGLRARDLQLPVPQGRDLYGVLPPPLRGHQILRVHRGGPPIVPTNTLK